MGGTKEQAHNDYIKHKDAYIKRAKFWSKKFKEENPEEWLQRRREYDREKKKRDRANPIKHEKMKESMRQYYWRDPQRHRDVANKKSKELRRKVFEHYGLTCSCCGENEYEFLTIDHINNDGAKHREEIFGKTWRSACGSRLYFWLIKNNFPEGFQTLCYNCNCARAKQEDKVCPHKKGEIKNGSSRTSNEEK